jgi:hypothetical protein
MALIDTISLQTSPAPPRAAQQPVDPVGGARPSARAPAADQPSRSPIVERQDRRPGSWDRPHVLSRQRLSVPPAPAAAQRGRSASAPPGQSLQGCRKLRVTAGRDHRGASQPRRIGRNQRICTVPCSDSRQPQRQVLSAGRPPDPAAAVPPARSSAKRLQPAARAGAAPRRRPPPPAPRGPAAMRHPAASRGIERLRGDAGAKRHARSQARPTASAPSALPPDGPARSPPGRRRPRA